MKTPMVALLIACGTFLFSPLFSGESSVIAPGATLVRFPTNSNSPKGRRAMPAGMSFFTDQPNNRIMKWSTDGKHTVFLQPSGRSYGLYFDHKGNLISCADEHTYHWSIAPYGTHTVLVKDFNGKPLCGPNDVWVRPDGAMYFTDPFYKRPWWTYDKQPQDGQHVYFLATDLKTVTRVTNDLKQPNGIIGTPDGKTLYVADIGANKTYRYDIQPDGTLANKKLHCEKGSDGMTLDNQENLYITGKGVFVFDKEGKQIEHIDVKEPWTANVCFGGKDKKTLFITASKCLYSIQMQFPGANPAK